MRRPYAQREVKFYYTLACQTRAIGPTRVCHRPFHSPCFYTLCLRALSATVFLLFVGVISGRAECSQCVSISPPFVSLWFLYSHVESPMLTLLSPERTTTSACLVCVKQES
eukprot:Blabericola_migrator_1__2135@NODE_158_length_12591_cov_218_325775_g138_i0_p8_GENE_NODE_158_length_12591_cov_218_325775_g138_i0NODE_158_length_12591_cov_218_325775_g138_i0_p8_ORF_typecomplete_len111_score3_24FANCL_C/PF11793_8/0_44FANCL_C/PF11793_8/1_2e03_NODE_158_length_12591_cov_218_325775_g138_i044274759